jgi:hypothetical protein
MSFIAVAGVTLGVMVIWFLAWRVLQESHSASLLRFRLDECERKLGSLGFSIDYGEDWVMFRRTLSSKARTDGN